MSDSGTGTLRGGLVYRSVVMDEATNRLLRELAGERFDGNVSMTIRMAVRSLANQNTAGTVQQSGGAS